MTIDQEDLELEELFVARARETPGPAFDAAALFAEIDRRERARTAARSVVPFLLGAAACVAIAFAGGRAQGFGEEAPIAITSAAAVAGQHAGGGGFGGQTMARFAACAGGDDAPGACTAAVVARATRAPATVAPFCAPDVTCSFAEP